MEKKEEKIKPSGNGYISINSDKEIYGGPLDGTKLLFGGRLFNNNDIVWWGPSQWYKWRWFEDHIDLGMLSIYNLKKYYFWRVVSIIIWPMRRFYHLFYCSSQN